MSVSWTERARGQLDLPLGMRHPLFLIFSVFLGFPLSLLWALGAAMRMEKRKKKIGLDHSDAPWIVSVGNVSVGGTGKSPVVRALARRALADGFDVAVLSRGHAASTSACVLVELSGQEEARLFSPPSGLWTCGFSDECLEHAIVLGSELRRNETVWVAQGSDRAHAMERLLEARKSAMEAKKSSGSGSARRLMILLDDGLSQTSIPVHRDVVVWDPSTLLSAPRAAMPLGPYRMGWPGTFWAASLPHTDLVVWSRLVDESKFADFQNACTAARTLLSGSAFNSGSSPLVGAGLHSEKSELYAVERPHLARVKFSAPQQGFVIETIAPEEFLEPYSVVTGMARPRRFVQTVVNLLQSHSEVREIVEPRAAVHLADHGPLSREALSFFRRPGPVVTSLKDLCRWWSDAELQSKMKANDLYVLCLDVELKSLHGLGAFEVIAKIFNPETEARKTDGKR